MVTSVTGGRIRAGAILEAGDQRFAVDVSTRLPADEATAVAITAAGWPARPATWRPALR